MTYWHGFDSVRQYIEAKRAASAVEPPQREPLSAEARARIGAAKRAWREKRRARKALSDADARSRFEAAQARKRTA